tara:strand:+ start:622 stop:1299 length:678 start_codon:yes stop_codon:yes gene_type:complete
MAQQHRDLRYPTVNFHQPMFLYDEPSGTASRYNLNYNFRGVNYDDLERALDERKPIAGEVGSAAPAGYYSSGNVTQQRGRGSNSYTLFKPFPSIQPQIDAFKRQQEEGQAALTKLYETQQADIAKQLKIVQGEKSAVSKAQETYSNMLITEAQRKKEAEAQTARNLQTQRSNQAMAGRSGSLQIQGASTTPRMGGTSQFRRRALQQGTASPYKGLSTIQSGMVNV